MAMAYITFDGVNAGPVKGYFPTQALANAAATGEADAVAHVGVLDVGEIPLSHAWFTGTSVVLDGDGALAAFNALSDTDKLKTVSRRLHDAYCRLTDILEDHDLADYFAREHVNWAHDFLAYAHRGTRAVMMSATYTTAQKLAWAQANGLGPTDVPPTNRPAFFEVVEDWTAENAAGNVPTGAVVFADPADATRWALSGAVSGTAGLEGLAAETDDVSQYIGGAWIADITA